MAWWSIVFYPATDAPWVPQGMIAMLCICVATLGINSVGLLSGTPGMAFSR
ncbi:hypothetical protein BYT27DRAFT_6950798 [Phlegmacium glaucopus]|nr:hypothetical protein BYT27DRAFT_6950798 [Phlegmacium glaucopus]